MSHSFTINATADKARTGTLTIGDRTVSTPFFMPVSTKATIKHMTFEQLKKTKTNAVIMNAFILSLRPGHALVRQAGGLHKFSTYNGVIATDSGGFQVLLPQFMKDKNDDGVFFKDPFSGSTSLFRPEDSVQVQNDLGSDIAMVLDDQPPYSKDPKVIQVAVDRTIQWAERSITTHRNNDDKTNDNQLIFAIGQGGVFTDIRTSCAKELVKLEADGYAVGGLAIGEPPAKMYEAIAAQTAIYPEDKPRYVMGLGSPMDIIEAVLRGADMFDSIFPTQSARHGTLFTSQGILRIGKKDYREDFSVIDPQNDTLPSITRAYLHHLLRVDEAAGLQLASLQNLWFMQWFTEQIREHIKTNTLEQFRDEFKEKWI